MFSIKFLLTLAFLFAITPLLAQPTLPKEKLDSSLSPGNFINKYKHSLSFLADSATYSFKLPAISLPRFSTKHPLQVNGGNISYYFDYRSNIDTPYTDKNVAQHNLVGRFNTTLFNALPFDVSFFIRRTNSSLFANINDVRLDFNVNQYAKMIRDAYLNKIEKQIPGMKDSQLEEFKRIQVSDLAKILKRINDPDFRQRLVECNEIIKIPAIAESIAGPGRADSVREKAKEFMETYQLLKSKEAGYRNKIDSLQLQINRSVVKARLLKETLNGKSSGSASPYEVLAILKQQGVAIPSSLRNLLSLRRFSLGRSQLNYSDLTARNLSINGINIEYNSWYYFALAAGTVDYRFRDFILTGANRKPQYMYLVRVGVGRLEKNYIILSAYRGQKQSYLQNNNNAGLSSTLTIYGMGLETRYRLDRNSYITAEIAQSFTPGINLYESQKATSFFSWSDRINKAYSVKLVSYFPKTKTRLDAMYRYSGAAFQSFDEFQGNSAREAWHIKAEQFFWKRQFKLSASIRNDEFYNPYIYVPYSNNSVSKSVQLTFSKRKWPTLSAGLMPYSQLSVLNNQVFENRFQTLNAVFFYQYRINHIQTSTTATYNRFYNQPSDTGFIYFNSVNSYVQQNFYFRKITLSVGGSHSVNSAFELNTLEESIQANLIKSFQFSLGLKVTNYNRTETQVGSWLQLGYRFMKSGMLQVHYENGLLPGNRGTLIRNQLCSMMLTKMF